VRQKERFKALRAEVDLLTLTATPIPRTLNMSMAGLRELSIIATPPAKRLAVQDLRVGMGHGHDPRCGQSRIPARRPGLLSAQ
jgi:RecG-like helicase